MSRKRFEEVPRTEIGPEMEVSLMDSNCDSTGDCLPDALLKVSDNGCGSDVRLWYHEAEALYRVLGLALGKGSERAK